MQPKAHTCDWGHQGPPNIRSQSRRRGQSDGRARPGVFVCPRVPPGTRYGGITRRIRQTIGYNAGGQSWVDFTWHAASLQGNVAQLWGSSFKKVLMTTSSNNNSNHTNTLLPLKQEQASRVESDGANGQCRRKLGGTYDFSNFLNAPAREHNTSRGRRGVRGLFHGIPDRNLRTC